MEAKIIVDGLEEASVFGSNEEQLILEVGLYFSQYVRDFKHEIWVEIER